MQYEVIKFLKHKRPTICYMSCSFFWTIPRCPNFMCQRFGTICLFHLTPSTKTELIVFQNVSTWKSDARESPKRKNITFRTWRKFKIKNMLPAVKCTLNPWQLQSINYCSIPCPSQQVQQMRTFSSMNRSTKIVLWTHHASCLQFLSFFSFCSVLNKPCCWCY
jgi:hypothetical protein